MCCKDIDTAYIGVPLTKMELFEAFEEEWVKGAGKNKERNKKIKEFRQYYEIDTIGNKYYIKRKYKDNEVWLIEGKSKFCNYITESLVKYLLSVDDNKETISYTKIFEIVSLVNSNYNKGRQNINSPIGWLSEVEKFDFPIDYNEGYDEIEQLIKGRQQIERYFAETSCLFKKTVKNSLDSMQRKSLLVWREAFILYNKPTPIYDDNGKIKCLISNKPHNCTKAETSKILDIQKEVWEEYDINKKQDLHYETQEIKSLIRKRIVDRINKEVYPCDYYGEGAELILGQKALEIEMRYIEHNHIKDHSIKAVEHALSKTLTSYVIDQFRDEYLI